VAIESKALQTDAWHHRSDAMRSLAAAVGISAALIGGPSWAQADDWAALFSCAVIIFNGLGMLRASIGEVLDAQAAPEIVTEILGAVRAVPGVTSVEKCRVRKSGFMRFADIHVRVAGESTVREGHDIAHSVKNRLLDGDFHLADIVVHTNRRPARINKSLNHPGLDDLPSCGDEQIACFRAEYGNFVF
jgi:cation diffusion facilitator family transporter